MKSVKDKLYENWEKFLEILKKNWKKYRYNYLDVPTYSGKDSEEFRALRDLVYYLTLTKKKDLQNCYEIFLQFFKISQSLL